MRPVFIWDCPVCESEHMESSLTEEVICKHCSHAFRVEE
jgi:DNA-directed RNA polymerase subunit RPC12/RpoP